ncbi:MAG: DUF1800 domain-containing protein [Acidobacteriota bacterium]
MPSQYEKTAHLMRRAAFGATPAEINSKVSQGLEATVDELVNYDLVTEDPSVPVSPTTSGGSSDIAAITIEDVATWWLTVMVRTKKPLRERMVHFWHDHFATSYEKVREPNGGKHLYWQNQLERTYATGNFRELCKGINRDPAMLRWLDSIANTKASPNENYGRELFEIFMLGFAASQDGTYSETDVQQAARAFTGWGSGLLRGTNDAPVSPNPNGPATDPALVVLIPPNTPPTPSTLASQNHDYNNKTVFGVVQNFNGDDIVDLVLDHEPQRSASARMLATKLFEHFAYEQPEAHIVDHLSAVLLRNNFSVKALLRDLFLNVKEFYSDKALQSIEKWPTVYFVTTLRLLGLTGFNTRNANPNNLRQMGQYLFWPPDVFGWPGREDWISTSQMLARANWANGIVASTTLLPNASITNLIAGGNLGATPTADQVVDYLWKLFVQRTPATIVRQALVDYIRKNDAGTIGTFSVATDLTGNYKKVRGLLHLLLARPETQNY